MLTSSDAKWRCMWQMMVWSILLTLVSQFLVLTDHIAFYIFASMCMLVLPVLTAVYSNTSGRRGSGLIRVAYVICDPVLACISITPVLLLDHLPRIVSTYSCLVQSETQNQTCSCMVNHSIWDGAIDCDDWPEFNEGVKDELVSDTSGRFVIIQMSIAVPILISFLMGRRTIKMSYPTYILTFAYWFVIAIESVDMFETIRLGDRYQNVIYTTMAIVSISMIMTNSYAVVTLCSFISPQAGRGRKQMSKQFDFVYRVLVGCSGILFTEIPLLVARFQILTADTSQIFPAAFYLWFIKDFVFMCLIVVILLAQKLNKKYLVKLPCKMNFDNPDIVFQPEKRDAYIERKKCVRFQDPPATTFGEESQRTKGRNIDAPTTKVPSSVLKHKNSSQLSSSNNNSCMNLETDGKQCVVNSIASKNTNDDTGSLVNSKDNLLCLPLTDHLQDSSDNSPSLSTRTLPRLCDADVNTVLPQDINSKPYSDTMNGIDPIV